MKTKSLSRCMTSELRLKVESISGLIHYIRGEKVIIDIDLAAMYEIEVKYLKRSVRRNSDRFPVDFMFTLTRKEYNSLRCSFGTLEKGKHAKFLQYAFTEQGVAMPSEVIKINTFDSDTILLYVLKNLCPTSDTMKKYILLVAVLCAWGLNSFAQFTFIHLSDMHVSSIPFAESDTNAQYFHCYIKEFANLAPKPAFVAVSGDVSNVGNLSPDGMYPVITQYLFPPTQTNPGIGDYYIDSAKTIPIYFVPGNHEYWVALVNPPVSNDTLTYYKKFLIPDEDYAITNDIAVIVFLRSGSDSTITASNKKGRGLSNEQIAYLRDVLRIHKDKRKIIVMHHPAVNAVGTNSDGTPFTGVINSPEDCSIANNRTTFLNICDSNHVDVVLDGHEHQNVVANRAGKVISENGLDSTRYVQTAAGFNRSYRIITVDASHVTVSPPLRSCLGTGVNEINDPTGISVFPNPAKDNITIICKRSALIEILDIEGQVIRSLTTDEIHEVVNVSGLQGGIYIIRAQTASGIVIKKLVKQ